VDDVESFDVERESSTLSRQVMEKLRRLDQLQKEGDASTQRTRQTQTEKLSRDFKTVLLRVEATNRAVRDKTKTTRVKVADILMDDSDDDCDDTTGLLQLRSTRPADLVAQEYADNERLIRDREEGIQSIEKSVVEVNEIFKDLNSLVVAQGEMVDSIEANIVTAADRVEVGTDNLVAARKSQNKATRKTIVIVIVLVAILVALILIIYFSSKK